MIWFSKKNISKYYGAPFEGSFWCLIVRRFMVTAINLCPVRLAKIRTPIPLFASEIKKSDRNMGRKARPSINDLKKGMQN
jgi:hypothetical protein